MNIFCSQEHRDGVKFHLFVITVYPEFNEPLKKIPALAGVFAKYGIQVSFSSTFPNIYFGTRKK